MPNWLLALDIVVTTLWTIALAIASLALWHASIEFGKASKREHTFTFNFKDLKKKEDKDKDDLTPAV